MPDPSVDSPGVLERLLVPNAFFCGLALAFAACCALGYRAAHRNSFEHLERFHQYLSPESLYYPTAMQVGEMARAELPPDKIAVIIGGNSALFGVGQRPGHVWSTRLQELLGDEYQVINLGQRGANLCEWGAVIAESLLRDRPRMIFITNLLPGQSTNPDGEIYKFLFWDAYFKGLLPNCEVRRQWINQVLTERAGDVAFAELRHQMQLDSALFFNELWNEVAYQHFSTVYTAMLSDTFLLPRKRHLDPEEGAGPLAERYQLYNHERAHDTLTSTARAGVIKTNSEEWCEAMPSDFWDYFLGMQEKCFPNTDLRRRTLFLVMGTTPYDLDKLGADDRVCFFKMSEITVRKLEGLGANAAQVCQNYELVDWRDWLHLSESGGAKLAEEVAPQVRQVADKLGYLKR